MGLMNVPPLLTLSYWFTTRPAPFQPIVDYVLLAVFSIILIGGIVAALLPLKAGLSKVMKRTCYRSASLFISTGITGLLLWFCSSQQLPILSMRFLFIAWLIWLAFGLYGIYRYLWIEVPIRERLAKEREEREKWLPKRKA
jgi:hypothetical protein